MGRSLLELLQTPSTKRRAAEGGGADSSTPPSKEKRAKTDNSRHAIDASGKKLQRMVNANKTKEQERKLAAELLQANANRFTAEAAAAAAAEEPSDAAEEVGEETWDEGRRLALARSAWARQGEAAACADANITSPGFDAAACGLPGGATRLPFSSLCTLFENAKGEALMIVGVANLVRQVLTHSASREQDLIALLQVLLASKNKLSTAVLTASVARAFAGAELRAEDLPAAAQAARRRQRVLFGGSKQRVLAADVATLLISERDGKESMVSRVAKVLGASVAESQETFYLVRILQGHLGFGWDVVLRALAHALVLSPPAAGGRAAEWADEDARARALVDMEDRVLRAYSQDGGRVARLVRAALQGEDMAAACAPTAGVPVLPMQATSAASTAGALETLGQVPVLAEWAVVGERAQAHVCGGKVVGVFNAELANRADRLDDAAAALNGHLKDVDTCILDIFFARPNKQQAKEVSPKKLGKAASASSEKEAAPEEQSAASSPPAKEASPPAKEASPPAKEASPEKPGAAQEKAGESQEQDKLRAVIVTDLLELNGSSFLQRPLRERRAELARILQPHARLRLVRGTEVVVEKLSEATIQPLLDEALGASSLCSGEEKVFSRTTGLVLKPLDGPSAAYLAGGRAGVWQALQRPPITGAEADRRLLEEHLTAEEKAVMPPLEAFHFSVVSGYRTRSREGIADILNIQTLYNSAGVSPTWYTDTECQDEYRGLGLTVRPGGKLIPARNRALEDAQAAGKICVETSDDIGCWSFLVHPIKEPSDEEANAASKRCTKLHVTPVAAARFLAAQMRARGEGRCMLGGCYPLSNEGRALRGTPLSRNHFILGDFFVAEPTDCRFDERMSLKEDYDFTCTHLSNYPEVLRCNRLLITAKHETNAGGACAVRDSAGVKERYNIAILQEKWPGAIQSHPTRANQVVLRWKSLKREAAEPEEGQAEAGQSEEGQAEAAVPEGGKAEQQDEA